MIYLLASSLIVTSHSRAVSDWIVTASQIFQKHFTILPQRVVDVSRRSARKSFCSAIARRLENWSQLSKLIRIIRWRSLRNVVDVCFLKLVNRQRLLRYSCLIRDRFDQEQARAFDITVHGPIIRYFTFPVWKLGLKSARALMLDGKICIRNASSYAQVERAFVQRRNSDH